MYRYLSNISFYKFQEMLKDICLANLHSFPTKIDFDFFDDNNDGVLLFEEWELKN